jgi:hypothetical protein
MNAKIVCVPCCDPSDLEDAGVTRGHRITQCRECGLLRSTLMQRPRGTVVRADKIRLETNVWSGEVRS